MRKICEKRTRILIFTIHALICLQFMHWNFYNSYIRMSTIHALECLQFMHWNIYNSCIGMSTIHASECPGGTLNAEKQYICTNWGGGANMGVDV